MGQELCVVYSIDFFWVRVGLIWNQAGSGPPARTQCEATRDGLRMPQGGLCGGGGRTAQGVPPCVRDGPLA